MEISLGKTVYVRYEDSITKLKVAYISDKGFIHSDAFNTHYCEKYRQPLLFKDEGKTWFRTLEEAEKVMGELVEIETGYYEAAETCEEY